MKNREVLDQKVRSQLDKVRSYAGSFSGRGKKRALKEFRKLLGACSSLFMQNYQLACAPGCHQCCLSMPLVWMRTEQEMIMEALAEDRALEDTVVSRVRAILPLWIRVREEYGLKPGEGDSASFERSWEDLAVPCPFLSTRGALCLIYKSRPIECRLKASMEPCGHPSKSATPVLDQTLFVLEEDLADDEPMPYWDIWKGQCLVQMIRTIGIVDTWLFDKTEIKSIPLVLLLKK